MSGTRDEQIEKSARALLALGGPDPSPEEDALRAALGLPPDDALLRTLVEVVRDVAVDTAEQAWRDAKEDSNRGDTRYRLRGVASIMRHISVMGSIGKAQALVHCAPDLHPADRGPVLAEQRAAVLAYDNAEQRGERPSLTRRFLADAAVERLDAASPPTQERSGTVSEGLRDWMVNFLLVWNVVPGPTVEAIDTAIARVGPPPSAPDEALLLAIGELIGAHDPTLRGIRGAGSLAREYDRIIAERSGVK